MNKSAPSVEQKRTATDLTVITLISFAVLGLYTPFSAQISSLVENREVPILLRTLVLALLQYGVAGLGITVVDVYRKESFVQYGLKITNLPKAVLMSVLAVVPYLAYKLATGTLTSYLPFQNVLQTKELLASSFPTNVLGMTITAIAWGFFEGFNYAVISDKINLLSPPRNLWLNWGAIVCGIMCLLIHGIVGVTPDVLMEAVTVFLIIYGMLVVKTYTGNAWGTVFLFLFFWNAL